MSRYIKLNKVLSELGLDHNDYIYIDKNETAERIRKIPSIDIVRCRDCKWHQGSALCSRHIKLKIHTNGNDFCSYGEVRDE